MSLTITDAQERVLQAALRVLSAERAESHAHADAEAEYASDLLALAARDLAEAVERAEVKPAGWVRGQQGGAQ